MNTSLGLRLFPSEMVDLRGALGYADMYQLVLPGQKTRESSLSEVAPLKRTIQHRDQMLPGVKAFCSTDPIGFWKQFLQQGSDRSKKEVEKNRPSEEMCIFSPAVV
ncbi:hypothetical protein V8V91_27090 [Algoriphagus halophilus]|uniref:hypothetical protein n=1 Tax=Algoriphagus halophilus TaxID=226505 RepID=UPI003A75C1E1